MHARCGLCANDKEVIPMQWKEENRALFAACLNGLEDEPIVRAMDAIPQHVKGVSCYDHCLFVAYVGFTLCRIFGLDYRAAARAGLLHDLYLQKWEETDVGRFRRLVIHPQLALENARAFGLSPMEEDIIGKHMWPLTAPLPYYKESYMVSLADKICAALEMAHLYGLLGVRRNLRACRPALLRRAVQ